MVAASRRGLHRRARRRSDHARHERAVSHVHEPRRVSPAAARGQRRSAPHAAGSRARAGRRRALASSSTRSAIARRPKSQRLERTSSFDRAPTLPTLTREAHAFDLLRRPEVSYTALTVDSLPSSSPNGCARPMRTSAWSSRSQLQVDVQAKYTGYIDRQQARDRAPAPARRAAPARRSRLRAGARAVDRSAAAPARSAARHARPGRRAFRA